MKENAAEVYAYLKQKYPDYNVLYNANISYIKSLDESPKKVLFLCKENALKSETDDLLNPNVLPCNNSSREDHNLTGSPLKDECEIDMIDMSLDLKLSTVSVWPEIEERYKGIDVATCRTILSDYQLQSNGSESNATLWILCDASDSEKTILQMLEFSATHNSRGIVRFDGIKATDQLDLTTMIKRHLAKIKGATKIDTAIDSFFSVNPFMTIKLSSTSSSLNPNINDFRNSEKLLYQTIRMGSTDSVAEHFWRQLCILAIIKGDIVEYKNSDKDGGEAVYRCGSDIDIETLREKITATLTGLSTFDSVDYTNDSFELEAVIQRTLLRNSFDVTDKLWEILKCCSSYRDLKAGFNIVFQSAAKCNIVNPPTNKNRVAELIREVSERRLAIPCLTGSEPLELLLEIGLEKISKDYEFIFTESKICSLNDLRLDKSQATSSDNSAIGAGDAPLNVRKSLHNAMQQFAATTTTATTPLNARTTLLHTKNQTNNNDENDFVGFQNSKFSRREIEYKLSRLAQIHLALEHLLQIQVNLNLENVYNQICQQLLQRPMQSFDAVKDAGVDRTEIPILTESIVARLENKDPHARRLVMNSENKFKQVQTTYYFNMDNIFPPNTFAGIESDDKIYTKENIYYSWEYSKFSVRRV